MLNASGVSIGYEPNPRASVSLHAKPQRREKVSDDLIKTLPAFSFILVERKRFETEFCRMIRLIGGIYMIKNKSRKNPAPRGEYSARRSLLFLIP
jgi:hypothetical protein